MLLMIYILHDPISGFPRNLGAPVRRTIIQGGLQFLQLPHVLLPSFLGLWYIWSCRISTANSLRCTAANRGAAQSQGNKEEDRKASKRHIRQEYYATMHKRTYKYYTYIYVYLHTPLHEDGMHKLALLLAQAPVLPLNQVRQIPFCKDVSTQVFGLVASLHSPDSSAALCTSRVCRTALMPLPEDTARFMEEHSKLRVFVCTCRHMAVSTEKPQPAARSLCGSASSAAKGGPSTQDWGFLIRKTITGMVFGNETSYFGDLDPLASFFALASPTTVHPFGWRTSKRNLPPLLPVVILPATQSFVPIGEDA